jgi:ubiquitin related modifier 1
MAVQQRIKVEFSGGLELLFSNRKSHLLSIPTIIPTNDESGTKPADLQYLIEHLREHLLTERPELFVENGTVYEACSDINVLTSG